MDRATILRIRARMASQMEALKAQLIKEPLYGNPRSRKWLEWKISDLERQLNFAKDLQVQE